VTERESLPVCPVQQKALVTRQHLRCVLRSIHLACCDRARDGRPHLALRSQLRVHLLRMSGSPSGESRHGVRKNNSLACLALPKHCHSTRIACNHILAREHRGSTRESCSRHWADSIVCFLYCLRIVLNLLLLLDGVWEPPSAATEQATNGWCLQHIIYTALRKSWSCARMVIGMWTGQRTVFARRKTTDTRSMECAQQSKQ
jgi:hypothetical protein